MNDSTKNKILEVSHKLFADKGFNAVSIREISKVCNVNVSAINYHFENKAKLYQQTIKQSIEQMAQEIEHIFSKDKDCKIEKLSMDVFHLFMSKSENLRASFRLILTSSENKEAFGDSVIEHHGPPGGEFFYQCLQDEFPHAKQEDLDWAVRSIFTQIIHKTLISCNQSICKSLNEMGITTSVLENDIARLVKIIKKELSE